MNRKTAPKVVDGKVQRKNRWEPTPDYYNTDQPFPRIDRRKPGAGYRHILRKRDVERFIALLPDWAELSKGLNAIVLAPGSRRCDGWHDLGVVTVCAWDRELWQKADPEFWQEHEAVFRMIGVACSRGTVARLPAKGAAEGGTRRRRARVSAVARIEGVAQTGPKNEPVPTGEQGYVLIHWTESTIRAYQLVHILLHELGHHHDRMTTRSKRGVSRGEPFAESYARRYGDVIWERYLTEFGLP